MHSFAFIVLALVFSMINGAQVEQDLLGKMLSKYDTRVRPVDDPSDAVSVTVEIYLNKMRNINEITGNVDISLWFGIAWNDSRLAWKPSDNKGTKKLIIPSKQIWVPDFFLYTGDGAVEESVGPCEKYGATVQSTGEVYYLRPVTKSIPCVHKTDKDGLVCTFSLESWTLPEDMMRVITPKKAIDTSLLGTYIDPTYKVKSTSVEVKKYVYPDIPDEKYDLVKGRIILDSKK